MTIRTLSNPEIALRLATQLRAYRIDPKGAGMAASELARISGMGLTPLRRFEKTGGITLRNFIALLRAMGLLERLEDLIPPPNTPSPMELLNAQKVAAPRQRAPRRVRKPAA